MTSQPDLAGEAGLARTVAGRGLRLAVLSDTHLSPVGTPDGKWNNVTRRSASADLLQAALAEIVAAGHDRVVLLGDVSDDGSVGAIGTALQAIAAASLQAWVVPGNHDVAQSSEALDDAAGTAAGCTPLHRGPQRLSSGVALAGAGLRSSDGGLTCHATHLPDTAPLAAPLLVWAGHYPLLSQQARLRVAGLRYPGDLTNLAETRGAAERFDGPILALHGHLHTAVTRHAGRILQIGVPAVVEWPHAWTDVTLDLTGDSQAVRAEIRPIVGEWSRCDHDTVLSGRTQAWTFNEARWRAPRRSGAGDDVSYE